MEKLIVFLCFLHVCYGVIYKLNDTDYYRMPPKYDGEPFESCHREDPEAIYCFAEYALVSDTPSPLLDMIVEFSAHNTTHFNHTLIRRGTCITKTCRKFINNTNIDAMDLSYVLEACLNESVYEEYQLGVKITKKYFCNESPENIPIDSADIAVAICCGIILLLNLFGTIYDPIYGKNKNNVSRFLLCFSIRQNWRKLTSPVGEGNDPRIQRLKSLHGVRTLSIALVIMGHSILACVAYIDNPEYVEQLYHVPEIKVIFNGMMIMQTFLVMSAFLLIYNLLLHAEKRELSWMTLPKLIVLRWLRLTPPYAVVLGLVVTWARFLSDGPIWQEVVGKEIIDCKKYWWQNLLYINNYNDDSQCMQQTWYLAADTQLYILGTVVFLACRSSLSKKIVLPILLVIGLIIPGIHTYLQDLDGTLIVSPEAIHHIFMDEPTFNNTYRRGHTNMCGYVIGIVTAFLLYHHQKKGTDMTRLRKYGWTIPLLIPVGVSITYIASIYFEDIPRPSLYIRVISSMLLKPAFAVVIAIAISSFILKIGNSCRRVVEWHGWTVPSRMSYSAYLVHSIFGRHFVGMQTTKMHSNFVTMNQVFFSIVLISFISAIPLCLLVEGPVGNLIKVYLLGKKTPTEKPEEENQNGTKANGIKKQLTDEDRIAIENIISLENLREILCDEQEKNFSKV